MLSAVSDALDRAAAGLYRRHVYRPARTPWAWPAGGADPGDWEPVRCQRSDGHSVAALYGRAEGPARGVVVCAHPLTREAKGYFLEHGHAAALRRSGYNVLLLDFGGCGETPLQSVLFPRDVLAAGEEAARRAPGLPVGFLGVCFGAVYGACAFSAPGHPFRAAVLDAPYTDAVAAFRATSPHTARARRRRLRRALVRCAMPLLPALDPLRQASRAVGLRGVLLVAGGADALSPPTDVRRYLPAFDRAGVPCDLWTVDGAEHTEAFQTASADYAARAVSFFDAHLAPRAGRRGTGRTRARPPRPRFQRVGRRTVGASGSGR